jgi:transcriptional regulator with XRE-family HTH domain
MPKSIYNEQYREMLALLRRLRLQSGVKQTDLVKQLRLDQSTISRIENGDRRLDVIELRAYCLAIGVTLPSFVRQLEVIFESGK